MCGSTGRGGRPPDRPLTRRIEQEARIDVFPGNIFAAAIPLPKAAVVAFFGVMVEGMSREEDASPLSMATDDVFPTGA